MNAYKYQDLQLSDLTIYNQFKQYWNDADYVAALNLLSSSANLDYKKFDANLFNSLFSNLTTLQNNSDPTFKLDKIQVASAPPTLTSGQIYFQII